MRQKRSWPFVKSAHPCVKGKAEKAAAQQAHKSTSDELAARLKAELEDA